MNTNVRIEMTDKELKQWKDTFGERATRKNIKARVPKLIKTALGGGLQDSRSDDDEEDEEDESEDSRPAKNKAKAGKKKFRIGGRK